MQHKHIILQIMEYKIPGTQPPRRRPKKNQKGERERGRKRGENEGKHYMRVCVHAWLHDSSRRGRETERNRKKQGGKEDDMQHGYM